MTMLAPSPTATLADLSHHVRSLTSPGSLEAEAPVPSGAVQHTTHYHLFSLLDANRPVNETHVQKLVQQIRENNLLHIRPIDVTSNLAVIDGQHRLAAARELGVPVYYRVTDQLTEADIASLNTANKNWVGTDYLHYWAEKGKPAYQTLTAFRKAHPHISFSNAKMMLSSLGSNMRLDEFNSGRWQATGLAEAEQVAQLLERIADEVGFKKVHHTRFVAALYRCVANVAGFNADLFIRKLSMQPRALRQQATDRQYLEMFQELYNYKTAQENRVRFL